MCVKVYLEIIMKDCIKGRADILCTTKIKVVDLSGVFLFCFLFFIATHFSNKFNFM